MRMGLKFHQIDMAYFHKPFTLEVALGRLSVMGHEQTSRHLRVMSDLPLKADILARAVRHH